MKRLIAATSLLTLVPWASATAADEGGVLRVVATNIQSDAGTLHVWVYDDPDTWLSDRYRTQKSIKVLGNRQGDSIALEILLPAGRYALSVFQDVNDDGKLARNFIGIPKEPAGLSNNVRPRFGPPKFKDAQFKVGGATVEQKIRLE